MTSPVQREQSTRTTTAKSPLRVNRRSAGPEPETLVDFVFVTVPALTLFDAGAVEGVDDGVADAEGVVTGVWLAEADVACAEGASEAVVGSCPPQPEIANAAVTTAAVSSVRPRRREAATGL